MRERISGLVLGLVGGGAMAWALADGPRPLHRNPDPPDVRKVEVVVLEGDHCRPMKVCAVVVDLQPVFRSGPLDRKPARAVVVNMVVDGKPVMIALADDQAATGPTSAPAPAPPPEGE